MKIRLLRYIPVGKLHGLFEGRIMEVKHIPLPGRGNSKTVVISDVGEEVTLWPHEYEVVEK